MRLPDADARRVLGNYRGLGARPRVHTAVRWITAPFADVEGLIPLSGDILDVGCGHGLFSLYLADRSAARSIHGVDIDVAKIRLGNRAIANAGVSDRVRLDAIGDDWLPTPDSCDAIVTNDVLYLLGPDRAARLLTAMAAALRPGGRIVVKEIGERPRWKSLVNDVQEFVATRVVHLTEGSDLRVLTAAEVLAPLLGAGLCVSVNELHRGYPHAHVAFVADRTAER